MKMPHPAIKPLASGAKVRLALVTGSGFGKTVMCGTAPKALFLTTDPEGALSASRMGSTAKEWSITSWEDKHGLDDAFKYMRDYGCKEFDWLIHDNATEEQQLAMKKAMDVALSKPTGANRSPDVPDKREYQIAQNGFIRMTKQFIGLPIHQIWTVHRKWFDPENGDDGFWSANIQGQQGAIAEQFLGYMNIIGHGEVTKNKANETVRRLYFTHYQGYRGKDRYQALGKYQDNLDIPAMMKLIEGSTSRRVGTAKKTAVRRTPRRTGTA
jgi:hypothetical protein